MASKVGSLSIEQTEAGDNKRGLKIIPAQPGSGVCNHAHTAVGHGPAGRRLHITHTATGDITLLLCVEATHYTHRYQACAQSWLLRYSHCMQCGWAGLGTAASYQISDSAEAQQTHLQCQSSGQCAGSTAVTCYHVISRASTDINHHITPYTLVLCKTGVKFYAEF